jgi:SPP1 family phage portal protein
MEEKRIWSERSIIEWLKAENNKITSGMFRDLIDENSDRHKKMRDLYREYCGDTPIIHRRNAATDPGNKVPNDFRGEIVDQKVGFSWGNPVSYTLDKGKYKDEDQEFLSNFLQKNRISGLDIRTAKRASICGTSSRLLYNDSEKNQRTIHIEPWETIFIYDQSLTDTVVYCLRYWTMSKVQDDIRKDFLRVEWYDTKTVYYFNEESDGIFHPDETKESEPHGFFKVPIIEFPNKEERLGDFEKVRKLIDAYDLIMSFNVDEIEAFRNAYLLFIGDVSIDEEWIKQFKKAGGSGLPEKTDARYLTKDINDQFPENVLSRLEGNIYKFSKTVDMSDEKFSGDGQSGESRKWKLKSLSDDALLKEGAFTESTQTMYEVLESLWSRVGIKIKAMDVDAQYTQNIPTDLKYHAETTEKLKGNVSEKTRLSLLPFIEDPEAEIAQMEKEANEILSTGEKIIGDNQGNQ